eukprot:3561567-Amphidinium_carterae.1
MSVNEQETSVAIAVETVHQVHAAKTQPSHAFGAKIANSKTVIAQSSHVRFCRVVFMIELADRVSVGARLLSVDLAARFN